MAESLNDSINLEEVSFKEQKNGFEDKSGLESKKLSRLPVE